MHDIPIPTYLELESAEKRKDNISDGSVGLPWTNYATVNSVILYHIRT
ncbi:hypothetical protein Ancab_020379 [Ancistrocladus abbreviatus]